MNAIPGTIWPQATLSVHSDSIVRFVRDQYGKIVARTGRAGAAKDLETDYHGAAVFPTYLFQVSPSLSSEASQRYGWILEPGE